MRLSLRLMAERSGPRRSRSAATSTIRSSCSSRRACCSASSPSLATVLLARVTGVDGRAPIADAARRRVAAFVLRLRARSAAAHRPPRSRAGARGAAAAVRRRSPARSRPLTALDRRASLAERPPRPRRPPTPDEAAEEAERGGARVPRHGRAGRADRRRGAPAAAVDRRLRRDAGARGDDAAARHRRDPTPTRRIDELRALFREQEYSRIPVYNENLDNIVGFIFVKDLIAARRAPTTRGRSRR